MASKGLLLINLGSPSAPERGAVARYLNEFLMDPFVIDLPSYLRWPLVRLIITPFRSQKSADAYRKVWIEQGSPLVHFTRLFSEGVKRQLGHQFDVRWAMRYGKPSIPEVLRNWNVDELFVVPLYPQYAESSTRTAVEEVRKYMTSARSSTRVHVLEDFYVESEFISEQANCISERIEAFKPDHILLSFHGLPEHHLTKLYPQHCLRDSECCATVTESNRYCYRAQAMATARALRGKIQFSPEKISLGFQSRLGRRPWIKPYTDIVIAELAASGAKRVLVSCPSFVADCLETLEEIQMRLREQFIEAGGEELELVPALNASERWIVQFSQMIERSDLKWKV